MGRLERLQKEITKNLNNGREVNDIIDGWSPNNLRRLLISPKVIIVEYHVTDNNKTKRLREIIDVEQDFKIELNKAMQDINSYKSILSCLVNTKVGKSTRVFSSIEEVIFFGNYPERLARLDRNLNILVDKNKLAQGEPLNELLKARFIRLSNISIINSLDESAILELADKCKKFGSSITMLAKSSQVEGVKSYVINPHDWWRGTYLRPKDYSMDEEDSRLSNYFRENIDKLEEVKKKQELEDKYNKIKAEKHKAETEKNEKDLKILYKSINSISRDIVDMLTICNDIYDYSVKLDKVQWSGYLKTNNLDKLCSQDMLSRRFVVDSLNKFNASALRQLLIDNDLDTTMIVKVLNKMSLDLGVIPKNSDSVPFDKVAVDRVFKAYLSSLSNVIYMVMLRHIMKTGTKDKALRFHIDKLNILGLLYTQEIIEYSDRILKTTASRKCLEMIENSRIIDKSDFNKDVKSSETIKILNCLKEYTKLD